MIKKDYYKKKWIKHPRPELLDKTSRLDPSKFYLYMKGEDIGPAGYGIDWAFTYAFVDERDFLAFVRYSLINTYDFNPENNELDSYIQGIKKYFDDLVDEMHPIRAKLVHFLKEVDDVLIGMEELTKASFSSFIELYNDIFTELNPSFKVIAHGNLRDYISMLIEEADEDTEWLIEDHFMEDEDFDKFKSTIEKSVYEKSDLLTMKNFLLDFNREP